MTSEPRGNAAVIDAAINALFAEYPDMYVFAVGPDGLTTPMPPTFPVTSQIVLQGHSSALDLVVPDDVWIVIDAWDKVLQVGGSHVEVHPAIDPSRTVAMHFADARERHGVLLCCVVGQPPATGDQGSAGVRPRLTVVRKDERAFVLEVDEAMTRIVGWSAEELVGRRSVEFIHPDDHNLALVNWMDMLSRPAAGTRRVRLRHRHKDGSWVWFEITNRNYLADPDQRCVLGEMIDISEEMSAHEALRAQEQLLRRLTEALPLGVLQIDAERAIVYRNDRLGEIVGVDEASSVDEQFAFTAPSDRPELEEALAASLTGRDADLQLTVEHREHGTRRCAISIRALTTEDDVVTGAILSVADITDDARLRDELERRATYDALTRCHNRAATLDALDHMLAVRRHTDGGGVAALFFDLDGFKAVNDRFGHAAGDELLRQVSRRLLAAARNGDLVGRLGGDEFLVICPGVASPDHALHIATRMTRALTGDITYAGQRLTPRASIGVAWTPGADDADTLVARADAAMYQAKLAGTSRPVLAAEPQPAPVARTAARLRRVPGGDQAPATEPAAS